MAEKKVALPEAPASINFYFAVFLIAANTSFTPIIASSYPNLILHNHTFRTAAPACISASRISTREVRL